MDALRLDYKNKHRRSGVTDIALLAASLIIVTVSGIAAAALFPRISKLEESLAHRHQIAAVTQPVSHHSRIDENHLRSELKQANGVVELLSLPWNALFADIEASQDDKVALLAIEPDPEKHTLMITAEAKDYDAMLSYMRLLQTRTSIKNVYLKSHLLELDSAEVPIRFVIVASWGASHD